MSQLTVKQRIEAYQYARLKIDDCVFIGVCSALDDWMEKNTKHIDFSISQFPEFLLQKPRCAPECFWWSVLDKDSRLEAIDTALQLCHKQI